MAESIAGAGIKRLNASGLPSPVGYCQLTVAQGTRLVHVSGQVGIDSDGELTGPDHRSQAEQAMRNMRLALESADASIDDIAKATWYVVDYDPEVLGALFEASTAVFGARTPVTATTLVGAAALADPRYQVEFEATAVLSAPLPAESL